MKILPLDPKVNRYLITHNLISKFNKQVSLLRTSPQHPSLHNELLEPRHRGIRSFRIDRTYRALFTYDQEKDEIDIIAVTKHYQ